MTRQLSLDCSLDVIGHHLLFELLYTLRKVRMACRHIRCRYLHTNLYMYMYLALKVKKGSGLSDRCLAIDTWTARHFYAKYLLRVCTSSYHLKNPSRGTIRCFSGAQRIPLSSGSKLRIYNFQPLNAHRWKPRRNVSVYEQPLSLLDFLADATVPRSLFSSLFPILDGSGALLCSYYVAVDTCRVWGVYLAPIRWMDIRWISTWTLIHLFPGPAPNRFGAVLWWYDLRPTDRTEFWENQVYKLRELVTLLASDISLLFIRLVRLGNDFNLSVVSAKVLGMRINIRSANATYFWYTNSKSLTGKAAFGSSLQGRLRDLESWRWLFPNLVQLGNQFLLHSDALCTWSLAFCSKTRPTLLAYRTCDSGSSTCIVEVFSELCWRRSFPVLGTLGRTGSISNWTILEQFMQASA